MKKFNFIYFFCSLLNKQKAEETIDILEKKNIWIAIIPCKIIINKIQVESAIQLAIRDFINEENRAKKINIQFLLRFFGEKQIVRVFEKLSKITDSSICMVAFYKDLSRGDIIALLNELFIQKKIIRELTEDQICEPSLEEIKKIYNISDKEIEAITWDDAGLIVVLTKLILERIALAFLK